MNIVAVLFNVILQAYDDQFMWLSSYKKGLGLPVLDKVKHNTIN